MMNEWMNASTNVVCKEYVLLYFKFVISLVIRKNDALIKWLKIFEVFEKKLCSENKLIFKSY